MLHELACLRNELDGWFRLIGWRWLHRVPKGPLEKLERELDYMKRNDYAARAKHMEGRIYRFCKGRHETRSRQNRRTA